MNYLPQNKFGNCTRCSSEDTECRKRGKDLVCLSCCKTEDTLKQIDKSKKRVALQRQVPKIRKLAYEEQDNEFAKQVASNSAALKRWFEDRRKEMTGICANCSGRSERDNDKYFKFSLAHILPKAYFKSVATHPDNWLELCYHGNSCHTNFDNHMIDIIDLNCFDLVIEKFVKMYPSIAQEEKRRIPPILIEYLKTEI